jgi:hypothetical protein
MRCRVRGDLQAEERTQRRLAAILASDVAWYSRLIEQDELIEFSSAVDAVECAVQLQKAMQAATRALHHHTSIGGGDGGGEARRARASNQ